MAVSPSQPYVRLSTAEQVCAEYEIDGYISRAMTVSKAESFQKARVRGVKS